MDTRTATAAAEAVVRTIREHSPLAWRNRELPFDLRLGASGLGLDSIAIVELLIECESAVGIPFPPALFDGGPLTVGRLVNHGRHSAS
jgi:acyl carrier protein